MQPANFVRQHAGTAGLIVFVIVPLLVYGGKPRDEDCPLGIWIKESGGCSGEHWECTSTGEQEPASVRLPLQFEKNLGQAVSGYDFLARTHAHSVLLSGRGALLNLRSPSGPVSVRMDLDGAPSPAVEPESQLPGVLNYFLGSDPQGWHTNVPSYSRVRYRGVYPGIDVIYYGSEGELEHDFVVSPGADAALIQMRFTGATDIRIEADGSASILAAGQRISWRAPVVYQELAGGKRQRIEAKYSLDRGRLGFALGRYDGARALVIDPVISYATYIGRSSAEAGARLAVDRDGNTYVVGYTMDPFFLRTPGAVASGAGAGNVLVTKLNPAGNTVLFSTFLGGANPEGALGIALDREGNLYIGASTSSADYPTTAGAFKRQLQTTPADRFDCAVTKLNAAGSAILYSTFLGGSASDACIGIAVDQAGAVYVTGSTESNNFPTSENAPQRTVRGARDGFLAKLNPAGSAVVYGTLFGGTGRDSGIGIAVDNVGAAYVVGNTNSSFGFPITPNAYQRAFLGTTVASPPRTGDAFALKMNPAGSAFEYSTYLGGRRDDLAFAVAVDAQGNAFVAGNTISTDFPTTAGALQSSYGGIGNNNLYRGGDGFVVKLNPTGSGVLYSTYLGGSGDDWATAIGIDAAGNAYLTGATSSPNFPVTQDAYQRTYGGTEDVLGFPTGDAFVAQLNAAGSALIYSTYLGGANDEFGFGIGLDSSNAISVSGMTRSRNFPVTPGAAQAQYGGADTVFLPMGDVFVARFAGTGGGGSASSVVLQGVANAASYVAGGVAPGEIIILGGANLGPSTLATLTVAANRVSTSLNGTRVV